MTVIPTYARGDDRSAATVFQAGRENSRMATIKDSVHDHIEIEGVAEAPIPDFE